MAVEKSEFTEEECVAVENSERELTAAKNAGIKCFVIPTGLTNGSSFTQSHKVLTKIYGIIDVFE